jgi:hypothetical protein
MIIENNLTYNIYIYICVDFVHLTFYFATKQMLALLAAYLLGECFEISDLFVIKISKKIAQIVMS